MAREHIEKIMGIAERRIGVDRKHFSSNTLDSISKLAGILELVGRSEEIRMRGGGGPSIKHFRNRMKREMDALVEAGRKDAEGNKLVRESRIHRIETASGGELTKLAELLSARGPFESDNQLRTRLLRALSGGEAREYDSIVEELVGL